MNWNNHAETVNKLPLVEEPCLRNATSADRSYCEGLFIEAHQAPMQFAGWDENQCRAYLAPQFEMREQDIRQKYPQADYDIMLLNGTAIGQMIINRQPDQIHIIDIVISNGSRQRGIGSYWLGRLCAEADAKRQLISLHVAFDNPAVGLYQRFGFESSADQDVYIYMQRQPEQESDNTFLKGEN